jgi:hypothetical protein
VPLTAFLDHGLGGTGEPLAALLRPGNAGSNTAADHITTAQLALAQLPKHYRRGRQTLIRTDSTGGTHDFVLAREAGPMAVLLTEAIHEHVRWSQALLLSHMCGAPSSPDLGPPDRSQARGT